MSTAQLSERASVGNTGVERLLNEGLRLGTDLLTERQAREEELPMSLAWFHRMRLVGGGPPFIRIANRVFYRRADLRRWIADREA